MLPFPYTYDYVPPSSFMRRVRNEVDQNIKVYWNSLYHRWDVFYKNPKTAQEYHILSANNLDQRIITRLQAGDTNKWPRAKEVHRRLVEREERWVRQKEEKLNEERKYKIKQDKTKWLWAMRNAQEGNLG